MLIKIFPSKTIAVTLQGGLGNQMFQYAAARCFAYRNSYRLWIDISKYTNDRSKFNYFSRYFNLGKFNISGQIINKTDFNYLFSKGIENKIWKYLVKFRIADSWKLISEEKSMYWKYDECLYNLTAKDNIWLIDGYWQNPQYFKSVDQLIREEFTLHDSISEIDTSLAENINACNSVSIHIRRGDMTLNHTVNKTFGLLGLDYYVEAVRIMANQIDQPHFFIFSDDLEWVEGNFNIPHPYIVIKQNAVNQDYLDLYLMSLCKNHIIANSTFSWWGAWLGNKKNQRVIAPKKPFRSFNIPVKEYYPSDWILI